MQVYKRSYAELAKNGLASACVGLVLYVWTTSYEIAEWISIALGILATIGVFMIFVFADNVRFEIEGAEFRCYKGKTLERTININECTIMPRKKGLTAGITQSHVGMDILTANGEIVAVDCRPIGERRYKELLRELMKRAKKS